MKNLTIAFLVVTSFQCLGQNVEWKTLKNEKYQVQYPSNWTLDQTGTSGTSFVLFGRGATEGKFRENINLMIQDLSAYNLDLSAFVQLSEEQVKTMVQNSKIVESKRIQAKPSEYHRIIFQGDQGAFKLKWKQYYWVINKKAYVLTFTGSQDTYDTFIETVDRILNSFQINEN